MSANRSTHAHTTLLTAQAQTPVWWSLQVPAGCITKPLVEVYVADVKGGRPLLQQRLDVL